MVKKQLPKRISRENLDDAIHTIFPDKEAARVKNSKLVDGETLYTARGLGNGKDKDGYPTLSSESNDVCAKKRITDGLEHFYIKFDGHNFYNPGGMYGRSDRGASKVPGLQKWRYTPVSKAVFKSYLQFLKTRNQVHLEHALREFS
jgi:hypothetical protein